MERVLHPLQGEHLGEEQIQDIGLDAGPILQGAGHLLREAPFGLRLTLVTEGDEQKLESYACKRRRCSNVCISRRPSAITMT